MKKFLTLLVTVILTVACAIGVIGCNKSGQKYTVYMPDGAPALALSPLMDDDTLEYHVVDSSTIQTYVSGEMAADFCVLPVNAAVKLLGNAQNYKMLGTVTHGNLFIMKKNGGEDINSVADLSELVGKTVGVINLVNVPGLTFKVILSDNNLQFNELKEGVAVADDKVNLKDVAATQVLPTAADCDYFVVPEPAATTKQTATNGNLSIAGSLQTLYGGTSGYPQAVLVAKKSVIDSDPDFVSQFIQKVNTAAETINSATQFENYVNAINAHMPTGGASSLNVNNLSSAVVQNCAISFTGSADSKQAVLAFMQKFNAVSATSWGMPADEFFY